MTTEVKTEFLDNDEEQSAAAAADGGGDKSSDNNDNIDKLDQQSTGSPVNYDVKKEQQPAEQILDLSQSIAGDEDDADYGGIRYSSPSLSHLDSVLLVPPIGWIGLDWFRLSSFSLLPDISACLIFPRLFYHLISWHFSTPIP